MAAALPFIQLASTAVGVISSISQGNASAAEANRQAKIAENNQTLARQQANAREELQRRQNAQRLGEQRALAAQSGFDPSTGSLLKIQSDSMANAELDALTTRYEGELQSLSFGNEAAGLRSQAKSARRSGYLNAAGTLLASPGKYGSGTSLLPWEPLPERPLGQIGGPF